MVKYPDYTIKRKRLNKKLVVVIFRRNNLSFNQFEKENGGYVFREKFSSHGIKGFLEILVHSDNLYDIFSINSKTIKICGGRNHFGIYLRFSDQQPPLKKKISKDIVTCKLLCEGKRFYFDTQRSKDKDDQFVNIRSSSSSKTTIKVPSSLSWSASHPMQGGGFSPR